MADMTELERRANQYITEHVAGGGKREDVLADWIKSDNPDLQKYAKGILVKDLNPDQAAAEAIGNEQTATPSYVDMAKGIAPVVVPAALTAAAVAGGSYYLGKKKGQGIAPSDLSDFEAKRQQLELERMEAQIETERARAARFNQMASKGQSLETQAKFSEPTAIEVAADTTSVKVPSPATVEAEISKPNPLDQPKVTLEDLQNRSAQFKAGPVAPDAPIPTPINASPAGDIPPAPAPSASPKSPITTKVSDTISDLIDEVDKPKTNQLPGPTVESFARDANGNIMWPEKMSPAGRAGAEAFMKQYPNHAAELAKEGRFGILGAGSGDNNLFNAYGADLRKRLLNELNQGQFVGEYGNYSEKIAPAIRALPPETGLGKELADMRINDPKSANRGGLGVSGAVMPDKMTMGTAASKALKAGGKAFLGVAIANAANAANKGDYVGAAKIMGPALDPTGTLEAAINPESTARSLTSVSPMMGILSQLFGSRADVDKIGGGRGITPASAYKR